VISVLLVDDHKIIRAGLAALINLKADMRVVGEASDGAAAIELCRQLRPDVITLDLSMPGMSGWQTTGALIREFPRCRILIVTSLVGDEDVYRALEAGALGYVLKEADGDELTQAIRNTHAGLRMLPRAVVSKLEQRLAFDPLTARELDVLRLIATGMTNRDAGSRLGLSEQTVKGYVKSITGKLGVADRTAATILALRRGLIHLEEIPPDRTNP
jgi:DNA-binding NarL/FixJ family response regulator